VGKPDDDSRAFIGARHVFFLATAQLSPDGRPLPVSTGRNGRVRARPAERVIPFRAAGAPCADLAFLSLGDAPSG
jgi:hypothetical protein